MSTDSSTNTAAPASGRTVLTDAWTGQQYVVDPDPAMAMSMSVERARDHWFDHMAAYDVLETVGCVNTDFFEAFDPDDAAYAAIHDDRDDDGDRCSLVTFYDAGGHEMAEVSQAGYAINSVPAQFCGDDVPDALIGSGAVALVKIRDFDWEGFARQYAQALIQTATAYMSDTAQICANCGSASDAPDPTCPACPETERVACYLGQCTYIASGEDDLARHEREECGYASERHDDTDEE